MQPRNCMNTQLNISYGAHPVKLHHVCIVPGSESQQNPPLAIGGPSRFGGVIKTFRQTKEEEKYLMVNA